MMLNVIMFHIENQLTHHDRARWRSLGRPGQAEYGPLESHCERREHELGRVGHLCHELVRLMGAIETCIVVGVGGRKATVEKQCERTPGTPCFNYVNDDLSALRFTLYFDGHLTREQSLH
jgi:hypothetical protein